MTRKINILLSVILILCAVGLLMFCGLVGGGVGLYLFFVLLDRVRR